MVHILNISNLLFTTLAHIIKVSVHKSLCSIKQVSGVNLMYGIKLGKSILNSLHDFLLHNTFTDIIFCTAEPKKKLWWKFLSESEGVFRITFVSVCIFTCNFIHRRVI